MTHTQHTTDPRVYGETQDDDGTAFIAAMGGTPAETMVYQRPQETAGDFEALPLRPNRTVTVRFKHVPLEGATPTPRTAKVGDRVRRTEGDTGPVGIVLGVQTEGLWADVGTVRRDWFAHGTYEILDPTPTTPDVEVGDVVEYRWKGMTVEYDPVVLLLPDDVTVERQMGGTRVISRDSIDAVLRPVWRREGGE